MIRASTTPSIFLTSSWITVAIWCAIFWSLPVTRMLIGVDLPSFIAERTMPPASKANSRSLNAESLANAVAQLWHVLLGRFLPLAR